MKCQITSVTLHSHGASASTLDGQRVWSLVLTHCHSHNSQSHTFLVLHERDWLASALGYLHKAIWLTDASVGAWKVFNFCREQRQWSDATDPQFSSATLDVTPFNVNERRWRRCPVWMPRKNSSFVYLILTLFDTKRRCCADYIGSLLLYCIIDHYCFVSTYRLFDMYVYVDMLSIYAFLT